MDIGLIDYFANSGGSFIHRALPSSKLIFAALAVLSVVIAESLTALACVYLLLLALAAQTRLPFIKIVSISSYPAIFALLFALTAWSGNWTRSAEIVLKALSAALAMVLLITTTPYPSVFARIGSVLPKIVSEGLLLTYRSLFILLGLMDNLVRALTVRGGFARGAYHRRAMNFASGIGLALVRGFDLSEKMYGVMKIRGYGGNLSGGQQGGKAGWEDVVMIALGAAFFGIALAWRMYQPSWEFEAFALAAASLAALASGIIVYTSASSRRIWKR